MSIHVLKKAIESPWDGDPDSHWQSFISQSHSDVSSVLDINNSPAPGNGLSMAGPLVAAECGIGI